MNEHHNKPEMDPRAARAAGCDITATGKNSPGSKPSPGAFWKPDFCRICNTRFQFLYTEEYAVARCETCGAPYKAFQKLPPEEARASGVDKVYVWELLVLDTSVAIEFLSDNPGNKIGAGVYDHNFPIPEGIEGDLVTKSGDTWKDIVAWRRWIRLKGGLG